MYVVMSASAKMPTSVKARYMRCAVVELQPGFEGYPKMISERARGVARIVQTWERQHVGSSGSEGTAFARAHKAAQYMCDQLNIASAQ